MEIGVRQGASTTALLAGIEEHGGHLWSVDIKECPCFPDHPQWTFIHADSVRQAASIKDVIPAELELLLIDGDHSYAAVSSDLENYGSMAKVIALHDVDNPEVATALGAYCYRNDLSYTFHPRSHGLGVIIR